MDHDLFIECAEALFGPSWVRPLAEALEVNERTVQRWRGGSNEVPDWVPGELTVLLATKSETCSKLLKKLAIGT